MNEENSNENSDSTELSEKGSWLYCPSCGNKLPKIKNIRFCVKCGIDLNYVKEHEEIPIPQYATPIQYKTSVPYSPYPSFSKSSLGTNFNAAELIQYLRFVGLGPSLKTCPK